MKMVHSFLEEEIKTLHISNDEPNVKQRQSTFMSRVSRYEKQRFLFDVILTVHRR